MWAWSCRVKYFNYFRKHIRHFIMIFCLHELSISHHLLDIPHLGFRFVILTFQGCRKSKILFCWKAHFATIVDTNSSSYRLRDIPHFIYRLVWPWFFRATESQIFQLSWKPHMRLYNGILLVRTFYLLPFTRYSDILLLRFRLVTLTFQGQQRSNTMEGYYENIAQLSCIVLSDLADFD